MNDLKTHLLDLAQRNPNMRAYRIAQEIKKFETTQQMAEENYRRQLANFAQQQNMAMPMQFIASPPRRNWLERFASYFSARGF